MKSQKKNKIY